MRLKFWLGIAVSAGLLVFLFSRIDFHRLWEAIKAVDPYYLAAAAAVNLAFYLVRALRWRYLMDPVKKDVPLGSLFSATVIGFMANNVLPARLGEIVRAYVLGRREDVPKSSAFATIVVERIFDGMSVLFLLIIVLSFMPPEISGGTLAATMRKAGLISLALYFVVIFGIAYLLYRPDDLSRIVRFVISPVSARWAEKAEHLAVRFMVGMGVARKPRLLALILFYSAVHWGLLWIPGYLMFKAFGLPYGVYAAVFLLVVIAFSVALPSTPGYVGTFHAGVVGGMMLFGMSAEPALSLAILMHAIGFIPVTLLGFYYLSRENLSLSGIKETEA
jgi:uncharacterized protein (TIRG00374 family)